MGLLLAGIGALTGALSEQWRDYYYCEALPNDVLVVKGRKREGRRSSNRWGSDNIITDGSIIAVNDGQCMMIVENGKIADFCAQPGEFIYEDSEPSLMYGTLDKKKIESFFDQVVRRLTFGGGEGRDQRVYYFNTKEIMGNKYGTPNAVPFRVIDKNIGLDMDISIRCHGEYSYKIVNPMLFYTNVCGNIEGSYTRDRLDMQLKTELMTALQPAFAKISAMGIRYSELPGHTYEIADALNEVLSKKWSNTRGIEVASFGISSIVASDEDEDTIKRLQSSAVMRDPGMAAAAIAGAQAEAMVAAAKNESGAANAFMGVNMAAQTGGMTAQGLYAMANSAASQPAADAWNCSNCGAVGRTGKFCSECGTARPAGGWYCSNCGAANSSGKFCSQCGTPR